MKGQSSIEFLAFVSMSMFMLAVLYTVMADKQTETFQQRSQDNAKAIAEKVSFNLEMALVQGQGYSRVISLPESISGNKYSMLIEGGTTRISWSSENILGSTRFTGEKINFTVEDGSNVFRVKNNNSGVFLIEP
jgi:hypothetical protein